MVPSGVQSALMAAGAGMLPTCLAKQELLLLCCSNAGVFVLFCSEPFLQHHPKRAVAAAVEREWYSMCCPAVSTIS